MLKRVINIIFINNNKVFKNKIILSNNKKTFFNNNLYLELNILKFIKIFININKLLFLRLYNT